MRTKELSSTWDGSRRSRPEGLTTPKDGSRDPTSRGQSDQGDQALAEVDKAKTLSSLIMIKVIKPWRNREKPRS
ncbi:hypothetical protein BU24DRAFT_429475 [Aaosphaeria arxii CBS 175.79]|uniref:Uncharacterized protein n=1 Tax=Aaosphaeria arxii CBS 175.79 TaxID=1450172 RepID=A0A6A5X5T3_9PLEO|nr:uncharacterized protein BU24DRAFT_429475 [Aaosphaeria arxii CBS 175.79]KAF2008313.1 hypothetical protein BU24DRAFT_429475 [Aaosphaeria arxii CBS 175.79]